MNILQRINSQKISILKLNGDSQVVQDLNNLSEKIPGYQVRNAQSIMARTIEECIRNGESAVIEAATGTGKSLGYLIPVVRSGKTTVISTSNKALQEQIFNKDIPFVKVNIKRFEAALVKGMNNFLCYKRLDEYLRNWSDIDGIVVEALVDALELNEGDFTKLTSSYDQTLASKINGNPDECTRRKCPHFRDCFYYKMRKDAESASIIVTNHTMLLLNEGGHVLPDYDVLIIDEAHNLEEEAQKCFSTSITRGRFDNLLNRKKVRRVTKDADKIKDKAKDLFDKFEGITAKTIITETLHDGVLLSNLLDTLAAELRNNKDDDPDYEKLAEQAEKLSSDTITVCTVKTGNHVHYAEKEKNKVKISCSPLDVSTRLWNGLFSKHKTTIATSATISATNAQGVETFDFYIKRTGMKPQVQKVLPSVFDYKNNALLYVPKDITGGMQEDRKAQWYQDTKIAERMQQLINISGGRAFLLFTGNRRMDFVHEHLNVPYPVLKQGDLPKQEMIKQFRQEPSILLGVASFWEGVDIAGDALSLVVIDGIPFDPPDPIHDGIKTLMNREAGHDFAGWNDYSVPRSIIKLKQGLGRLIRTSSDRGVMAILDNRLLFKSYGKRIRQSLPPAPITSDINDVTAFFNSEGK